MNPLLLPSTSTPAAAPGPGAALRFLRRGLISLGFGVLVAACLSLLFHQSFGVTLVYSLCISLVSWFCIDTGRMLLSRWVHRPAPAGAPAPRWPGWGWMAMLVPVGTIVGFSGGTTLANWITGINEPGLVSWQLRQLASMFVISLIPAVGVTYLFYSRERLASSE